MAAELYVVRDDEKEDQRSPYGDGGINTPELSEETLKPSRKAIRDGLQAWSIFSNLRQAQQTRNDINAKIQDNLRGRAPYPEGSLAPWQSNFSILFLSGILDKVVPVLTSYVENAKWLTLSKLKDESLEAQEVNDKLRELFTRVVRRWPGWRSFVSALCQEICLIGYTYAIRTDEWDWRPKHYRQDQAYVPEHTSQFADHVQVLGVEEDFLLHALVDIIQDREAAEAAKWDVDNTVAAINKALPKEEGEDDNAYNQRGYIDALQEGNLGCSYEAGAKVIQVAHVLAIETGEQGKVTHYIVDRNGDHKTLLAHESRFKSMRDVVTLFTLDPGNGSFYGSRGIGARLVNYSVAMNGVVNDAVDSLRLAGLLILQGDTSKGVAPPKVKNRIMWLNKDSELVQQRSNLAVNAEAFVLLINKLGELAEVAAQQYIPNTTSESNKKSQPTAREVTIDYQREQQSLATFVGRFAAQFAEMIGMMQRAMFDPDTNDPEAKEARKIALEICNGNEKMLQEWATSPAAEVLQDLTEQEAQAKLAIANDLEVMTSPAIDQKKRLEMKLYASLPIATAQSLLKKDYVDPSDEAEQIRAQMGETEDILKGNSIPVSGRDNDKVHLDILMPDLQKGQKGLEDAIAQNPQAAADPNIGETIDHFNAGWVHAGAHVGAWQKKGVDPQSIAPYEQAVQQGHQNLEKLGMQVAKARNELMKQQQEQQQGAPQPGQPPPAAKPPDPVEPADLVKMYTYDGTPDDVRRQIEADLGLKPHQEEPPTTLPTTEVPPNVPQS